MESTGTDRRRARIRAHYEHYMAQDSPLAPLGGYFEKSGFANYGYWEPETRTAREACENMMERLLAFLPDRSGTILDVACGLGATTRHLVKSWAPERVTAVDLGESNIVACRKSTPGVTFRQMDATRLDFPDGSFDAVLCVEAAMHFQPRSAFLSQAFRILKPGGRLLLADMLCDERADATSPLLHPENHAPDPDAYAAQIRRAGFDPVEVQDVTEPCWVRSNQQITRYLCDAFRAAEIDRPTFNRAMFRRLGSLMSARYYVLAAATRTDRPAVASAVEDASRADGGARGGAAPDRPGEAGDVDAVEFPAQRLAPERPEAGNGLRTLVDHARLWSGRNSGGSRRGALLQALRQSGWAPGPGRRGGAGGVVARETGAAVEEAVRQERINEHYDDRMYGDLAREMYEGTDFHNLGYWPKGTDSLPRACEALVTRLLDLIPDKRGRILDVACGKGASTQLLLRHYPPEAVAAVNISRKQLRTARDNAPGAALLVMDAARLGFSDASFDNLICVEAACHFRTREAFLVEAYRVLKPGGRLVFSDLLAEAWMEERAPGRMAANTLSGPEAYATVCRRAGFRLAEVVDATEETWVPYGRHLARFLARKLRAGGMDRRSYNGAMAYLCLMAVSTRHYVIGWAEKD